MWYRDKVDDMKSIYDVGLTKFLESRKYHKIIQQYLEKKQDLGSGRNNKLDKILGIKD